MVVLPRDGVAPVTSPICSKWALLSSRPHITRGSGARPRFEPCGSCFFGAPDTIRTRDLGLFGLACSPAQISPGLAVAEVRPIG
jgi:hypothetical protein